MQTSESISKIAAALLEAQKQITFAVKDKANPAFRGSKYADLAAVIEAIKPALNGQGISFIQLPAPSDHNSIALSTRLLHGSGEWIESVATAPLAKVDPQGYGSAMTYLRRYSLAAAVGLYQDDDDGNSASAPSEQPKQRRNGVKADVIAMYEPLPPDQVEYLDDLTRKVVKSFEKEGVSKCCERLDAEKLEDVQLIYLTNQLPSNIVNAIKKEQRRLYEATRTPVNQASA